MSEKLKIVGLKMENVKRIEAVELQFDENNKLIEITGANGQGKTSLLDGLKFLFSGKRDIDAMPVRDGQEKGMVEIEVKKYSQDGSLIETGIMIQKKFNPSGPVIKIYKKQGVGTIPSSQQLLDTLYDAISFDPLAFAELSKTPDGRKKQVELLKRLTKLDFSVLEGKYREAFEKRTAVNRDVSAIETKLVGRVIDESLPSQEQSAVELVNKIQAANDFNKTIDDIRQELIKTESNRDVLCNEIIQLRKDIEKMTQALISKEGQVAELTSKVVELSLQHESKKPIDTEPLKTQLSTIEETNKRVRENHEILELQMNLSEKKFEQQKLDDELKSIKEEKQKQLQEAKMPIPGMSFNSDGILINGIPFEQVNDADKLKTSVAMAMALNPVLRVILIKNGSLLDRKNYEILKQMATDNDYTIFLERVDESGTVGIVIEEGKVKVNNYESTIPVPPAEVESTVA